MDTTCSCLECDTNRRKLQALVLVTSLGVVDSLPTMTCLTDALNRHNQACLLEWDISNRSKRSFPTPFLRYRLTGSLPFSGERPTVEKGKSTARIPFVFVFGCGRSGTTAVARLLSSGPTSVMLNEPRAVWINHLPSSDVWSIASWQRCGRLDVDCSNSCLHDLHRCICAEASFVAGEIAAPASSCGTSQPEPGLSAWATQEQPTSTTSHEHPGDTCFGSSKSTAQGADISTRPRIAAASISISASPIDIDCIVHKMPEDAFRLPLLIQLGHLSTGGITSTENTCTLTHFDLDSDERSLQIASGSEAIVGPCPDADADAGTSQDVEQTPQQDGARQLRMSAPIPSKDILSPTILVHVVRSPRETARSISKFSMAAWYGEPKPPTGSCRAATLGPDAAAAAAAHIDPASTDTGTGTSQGSGSGPVGIGMASEGGIATAVSSMPPGWPQNAKWVALGIAAVRLDAALACFDGIIDQRRLERWFEPELVDIECIGSLAVSALVPSVDGSTRDASGGVQARADSDTLPFAGFQEAACLELALEFDERSDASSHSVEKACRHTGANGQHNFWKAWCVASSVHSVSQRQQMRTSITMDSKCDTERSAKSSHEATSGYLEAREPAMYVMEAMRNALAADAPEQSLMYLMGVVERAIAMTTARLDALELQAKGRLRILDDTVTPRQPLASPAQEAFASVVGPAAGIDATATLARAHPIAIYLEINHNEFVLDPASAYRQVHRHQNLSGAHASAYRQVHRHQKLSGAHVGTAVRGKLSLPETVLTECDRVLAFGAQRRSKRTEIKTPEQKY